MKRSTSLYQDPPLFLVQPERIELSPSRLKAERLTMRLRLQTWYGRLESNQPDLA
jgi:hypothetical protein